MGRGRDARGGGGRGAPPYISRARATRESILPDRRKGVFPGRRGPVNPAPALEAFPTSCVLVGPFVASLRPRLHSLAAGATLAAVKAALAEQHRTRLDRREVIIHAFLDAVLNE